MKTTSSPLKLCRFPPWLGTVNLCFRPYNTAAEFFSSVQLVFLAHTRPLHSFSNTLCGHSLWYRCIMCGACPARAAPCLCAESKGADKARWLSALFASEVTNAVEQSPQAKHCLHIMWERCVYACVCVWVCVCMHVYQCVVATLPILESVWLQTL